MRDRQTVLGIVLAVGLILAILLLSSCATESRWLTKEQDAEMRANCEAKNCVVVPGSVWLQIIQALQGERI